MQYGRGQLSWRLRQIRDAIVVAGGGGGRGLVFEQQRVLPPRPDHDGCHDEAQGVDEARGEQYVAEPDTSVDLEFTSRMPLELADGLRGVATKYGGWPPASCRERVRTPASA